MKRSNRIQALVTCALAFFAISLFANDAEACKKCRDKCKKVEKTCKKDIDRVKGLCKLNATFKTLCKNGKETGCHRSRLFCEQVDCRLAPAECKPPPPDSPPASSPARVAGEPHVRTVDGLAYAFHAAGEFTQLKSATGDFEVQVRLSLFKPSITVATAAAVRMNGMIVSWLVSDDVPKINGVPATLGIGDSMRIGKGVRVSRRLVGQYLVHHDDYGTVRFFRRATGILDAEVFADPKLRGKLSGLVGNADGNPDNDLTTREGKAVDVAERYRKALYEEFGDSWRISQSDSFLPYGKGESTKTFTDKAQPKELRAVASLSPEAFRKANKVCADAKVADGLIHECIFDVGFTGDALFADAYKGLVYPRAKRAAVPPADKPSLRAAAEAMQGQDLPVFWAAPKSEGVYVTLFGKDGKEYRPSRVDLGRNPMPAFVELPVELGPAELRMVDAKSNSTLATATVTITKSKAELVAPEKAEAGDGLKVVANGPRIQAARVVLADPKGKVLLSKKIVTTNDVFVRVPAEPGAYTLRYELQGSGTPVVLFEKSLAVSAATWTIKATIDGDKLKVEYPRREYVSVRDDLIEVWQGAKKLSSTRVRSSPTTAPAPAAKGEYEVRYVGKTEAGLQVIATAKLTVP